MFAFRSWSKWQGKGLSDVKRMRDSRGTDPSRPYAMGYVIVATTFDDDFKSFAGLVGGQKAETFLLRAIQYAGLHSAFAGEIHVAREKFGPVVLTREWDIVSARAGSAVYDALLTSGLVQSIGTRSERERERDTERAADKSGSLSSLSERSIHPFVPGAGGQSVPGDGSSSENSAKAATMPAVDRAVLDVLDRKYGEASGHSSPEWRELRDARKALDAGKGDIAATLALIDRLTPRFAEIVLDVRRSFTMADKARKQEPGAGGSA